MDIVLGQKKDGILIDNLECAKKEFIQDAVETRIIFTIENGYDTTLKFFL